MREFRRSNDPVDTMSKLASIRKMASTHYSQHISLHPAYPFIITEEEKSWKKVKAFFIKNDAEKSVCKRVLYSRNRKQEKAAD